MVFRGRPVEAEGVFWLVMLGVLLSIAAPCTAGTGMALFTCPKVAACLATCLPTRLPAMSLTPGSPFSLQ